MFQRHPGSFIASRMAVMTLLIAVHLLGYCRLHAVDPLPEELENASEEAIDAYIEKEAEESLRLKREVGKRRFEEKQEMRREAVAARVAEVERRTRQIEEARNLERELAERDRRRLQIAAFLAGFALLSTLGVVIYRNLSHGWKASDS